MMTRGRKIVLAVIAANMLFAAAEFIFSLFMTGPGTVVPLAGRLVLSIVFFCFLYRGFSWARWAAVILFVLSGLAGIAGSLIMLLMLVDPAFCITGIVMSLVQLASAALLIFSPSVKVYFGGGRSAQ